MSSLFLFIAIAFLFTFFVGKLVERIRVPWVFAAFLFGLILAAWNPFYPVTNSESFTVLAELGMYFLLFIVGFEINLSDWKRQSVFVGKTTVAVILAEIVAVSGLVYLLFDQSWFIAVLVAASFATVGEAMLLPILEEFRILKTRLGQAIVSIGTLTNIVDIIAIIIAVALIGDLSMGYGGSVAGVFTALGLLFLLTVIFAKFGTETQRLGVSNMDSLFLFSLFVLFLFLGIGAFAGAAPLAALLAGISLRTFVPQERLATIESEVRTMSYGLFAPLFFIWIGLEVDLAYLLSSPLVILVLLAVTFCAKILASYFAARKELGGREAVLLGIGLSVRFSIGIIIVKMLHDNGLIGVELFSVIVAASILSKFIVPVVFSTLLARWKIAVSQSTAS